MNPTQDINQARQTGQQLQNQYNQQANQSYGQYQDTYNQAQGAQKGLQDYTKQIAGQNYGNVYGQDLSSAQTMYGFDPKSLALANRNLLQTQTAMQYAPQAAAQAGNYYGGTAGQAENAYQNMAGNLNTTLANQSNAVGQYKDLISLTQNQANQQTTQQLAGQQQALSGYEATAQNSTNIMNNAAQTMSAIEKLQQDQGTVTAGQIKAYQDAYSTYITAAAQANAYNATANQTVQNTIDQGIKNHPNATNAQLAAELNVPESVIAGIRPYNGPVPAGTDIPGAANQNNKYGFKPNKSPQNTSQSRNTQMQNKYGAGQSLTGNSNSAIGNLWNKFWN